MTGDNTDVAIGDVAVVFVRVDATAVAVGDVNDLIAIDDALRPSWVGDYSLLKASPYRNGILLRDYFSDFPDFSVKY